MGAVAVDNYRGILSLRLRFLLLDYLSAPLSRYRVEIGAFTPTTILLKLIAEIVHVPIIQARRVAASRVVRVGSKNGLI